MSWHAVVVGVDDTSASAGAAAVAEHLSRVVGAPCVLVHAVRDQWAPLAAVGDAERAVQMQQVQLGVARHQVQQALKGRVAPELIESVDVRFGPAPLVLQHVAAERDAGMIVLGGKHHSTLERWLGGSTALHVVRAADRPVLVTAGRPPGIRRILAAADLSAAARPTLALAQRFARISGAQLRVVSVFEPLPVMAGVPPVDPASYYELAQGLLEREIWPLLRNHAVEKLVRHGMVVETLLREAVEWGADLLVLGSHGKGWAQRMLLGSVTERLLNDLPTSLLIAPIHAPKAAVRPQLADAGI